MPNNRSIIMKSLRLAAYLSIVLHFLREIRRKLLKPPIKSNTGASPDPWIVYVEVPSHNIIPVAICKNLDTAIRMDNLLTEYCTRNTLLNNHIRICRRRAEPGYLSDTELDRLNKYVIFLYIYNTTYIEEGNSGTSPMPKFSNKVVAAAKAAGMKR